MEWWYHAEEYREPSPCYKSMDLQTNEREELYKKVSPPGDPILINVKPFDINNKTPEDVEIRAVVNEMKNDRAGGASIMRAEDLKEWLTGIIDKEENGTEGAGEKWRIFVRLIQTIWEDGELPQ